MAVDTSLDPYHSELKRIRRSDCITFKDFDEKYNIDTSHPIELAADNSGEYRPGYIPNENKFPGSSGFQNTPLEIIDHFTDFLKKYPEIEDYTFIDIGSGKGKVIFYNCIIDAPYKKYIGIEIDNEFNDIAINNLKTININITKDIKFIESDICDYVIPDSPCIYYFYYPFNKSIFDIFINKNIEKMKQTKSLVVILFEPEYDFGRFTNDEPIYNKYKTKIYEMN